MSTQPKSFKFLQATAIIEQMLQDETLEANHPEEVAVLRRFTTKEAITQEAIRAVRTIKKSQPPS